MLLRKRVADGYVPLNPTLYTLREEFLEDDFLKAVEDAREGRCDIIESLLILYRRINVGGTYFKVAFE